MFQLEPLFWMEEVCSGGYHGSKISLAVDETYLFFKLDLAKI